MRLPRAAPAVRASSWSPGHGCTLCAAAEPVVAAGRGRRRACRFEVRDVDADPEAGARWTDTVPVVLLDGVEHAYWRVDERRLRKARAAGAARVTPFTDFVHAFTSA